VHMPPNAVTVADLPVEPHALQAPCVTLDVASEFS
jgi:hypothetical protein